MSQYDDKYIIDNSAQLPLLVKFRDFILTLVLWVLYFYSVRDAYPFILDFIHWIGDGFADKSKYPSLAILPTFYIYFKIALIMGATYMAWALYNLVRFRGRERRKFSKLTTVEETADFFKVPVEDVKTWQQARTMVMHHDKRGKISSVKVMD